MICKSCHSDDLREEKEFATFNPETDLYENIDGFQCLKCGCFMEKNGLFYDVTTIGPIMERDLFK